MSIFNLKENEFDIRGVKRCIVGFNKVPNKYGNHLFEVSYDLKPIPLSYLQKLFNIDPRDPDLAERHMIYDYNINEMQAKALQPYIKGEIDFDKYLFQLACNSCEY